MKLLSYLNVSNISNIEADSGYIFQKLLLNYVVETKSDIEVYLICPKDTPEINENIKHIILDDNYLNKYSVRFNFPWNKLMEFSGIFKDLDLIIVNQPELKLVSY